MLDGHSFNSTLKKVLNALQADLRFRLKLRMSGILLLQFQYQSSHILYLIPTVLKSKRDI